MTKKQTKDSAILKINNHHVTRRVAIYLKKRSVIIELQQDIEFRINLSQPL
jgi:hypothetical protein